MASKTVEQVGGVWQWPTPERLAHVRRTVVDAYNALEHLTHDYTALNNKFDPCDIAAESVPVTSDSIAAVVEFLMETECDVEAITKMHEEIARWPGIMAHTRMEQRVQAATGDAGDDAS